MTPDLIAPVVTFHQQLTRLSAAGLPFDLGLQHDQSASSHVEILNAIKRVEDALRLRVELGQPLVDAINAATELTPRHRASLLASLDSGDAPAIFESLSQPARSRARVLRQVGISTVQPFVLMLLTFLAFILLCLTTIPRLEMFYAQLWKQPSRALNWLLTLRDTMPIWSVLLPVLFISVWFYISRRSSLGAWRWMPGATRYLESMRLANFADQVATYIDRGISRDHAMALADANLAAELNTHPSDAPPLLRWALMGDLGDEPAENVFRFVASSYRQSAEQFSLGWRVVLPAALLPIFGGALVFAFGLSLFVPMIELMKELTLPRGI